MKTKKFIFVTGGVVSSLGKGVAAASMGAILEARGLKVNLMKLDPYINVDPGTMNPFQHGEVFVTDDGAETDLDLGHYERFTSITTSKKSNVTTGKIYYSVIQKERRGDYLGATVQVVPHITNEIKSWIDQSADDVDVAIVEVGGTVGDIESLPFLETIRQMRAIHGKDNTLFVHVTLVPHIHKADELKTKPTQHSVKELRSIGIQPDIILCRSDMNIPIEHKEKIALFCNVSVDSVISARDVECIYEIPLCFHEEGLDNKIGEYLKMWTREPKLEKWESIIKRFKHPKNSVTIGVVGKYVELKESYKSLSEAIIHGGIANDARVTIEYIDSETLSESNINEVVGKVDGILIPGGFGPRGVEGKILATKYAREKNVPFFGICLGMQVACIEFARNVCGIKNANSFEFDANTPDPIIGLMDDQQKVVNKGGTMRLGAYTCKVEKKSHSYLAYGSDTVSERHRHRYEFNNSYRETLESKGMKFVGVDSEKQLVEIVEVENHPWFVAVQFHPEFKSRPTAPQPLFQAFVKASLQSKNSH